MEFIQNIQNSDAPIEIKEKKQIKKGKAKQKKFEPVEFSEYETSHSECELIFEKYIQLSDNENLKEKIGVPNIGRRDSQDSEGLYHVKKETEPVETNEDELLDIPPEVKLREEVLKRQKKIAKIEQEIEKSKIDSSNKNKDELKNLFDQKCSQYEPTVQELLEKNTMGCAKIDTLQGKVRRSREKIDQILNDLQIYHTEYEAIQVNKK
jgi:hypothetical protein